MEIDQRPFNVNNLDLLRLFAATQVLIDHYYQHLNIAISPVALQILYLFPGVPVFFVISGFLVSASFERNNDIKRYALNRVLRIFPALWVCILITIVCFSLTGANFFNKEFLLWLPFQLIGLVYTPHFLQNYGFGSYNGSLWTIPIELQFYILIPVIYWFFSKVNFKWFLLFLFILFAGFNLAFKMINIPSNINKFIGYTFIVHFYLFLLGVIFQRLQLFKRMIIYNKAIYWVIVYCVYSFLFFKVLEENCFLVIQYTLCGFCVLSIAYTCPDAAQRLLRGNDISYGIYIYHGLLLALIVQLHLVTAVNLPAVAIVTFIIAYISWISVERPSLRLKHKRAKLVN
jgi:peptidoglycan/LPS O-acetylase OafA/YrhL